MHRASKVLCISFPKSHQISISLCAVTKTWGWSSLHPPIRVKSILFMMVESCTFYAYIQTDRQTDRQTYIHTYTHTIHTHTCMHAYIHTYIHIYIFAYIYICIYEDIPIECNRPIIMILSSWWDNRTPYTQHVSSDIPMMLEYVVIKHHFCQFKPACWYCCCWCSSSSSCFSFFKTYVVGENHAKPM